LLILLAGLSGIYLALGLLFAVVFVLAGYAKIDASAKNAGWQVRLMWMPGAMLLWPVLLARWSLAGSSSKRS